MLSNDAHGRAAIFYLQRRIILNWFRRSIRSPFFWLIGAFILFVLAGTVASIIDRPDDPGMLGEPDEEYFRAGAALFLLGGIIIGLWRGTTNTPGASLADVVLLMGSPCSTRLQFALLMARPSFLNAGIISLWAIAASSGLLLGVPDQWIVPKMLFTVAIVVLLSEFLRNAVWIGTEQVVATSIQRGYRVRFFVKLGVFLLTAGVASYLVWPLTRGNDHSWQDALQMLAERGEALAVLPPLFLLASVLTPGGMSLLSAIALSGLTFGIAVLAIYWARDFAEPVSVIAERKTDARGQMLEAGSDVQWAALSQFGVSPQLRVGVPAFGRGSWALLWGSLTRWVRYQIAAAWITLVIIGGFGVLTAVAVQLGFISLYVAWGVALMFPFFGSVNMFMDELRRQFMFLIPGSASARLTAAALTSVLDGMISCLIITAILAAIGVVPVVHAIGLLLLGMAISLLGQASVAIVQILLPFWAGQRTRVSVTFGLTGLAFIPSILVLVGLYVAIGPVAGLLSAAVSTLVIGTILLIVAGLLFDRIEYSG